MTACCSVVENIPFRATMRSTQYVDRAQMDATTNWYISDVLAGYYRPKAGAPGSPKLLTFRCLLIAIQHPPGSARPSPAAPPVPSPARRASSMSEDLALAQRQSIVGANVKSIARTTWAESCCVFLSTADRWHITIVSLAKPEIHLKKVKYVDLYSASSQSASNQLPLPVSRRWSPQATLQP